MCLVPLSLDRLRGAPLSLPMFPSPKSEVALAHFFSPGSCFVCRARERPRHRRAAGRHLLSPPEPIRRRSGVGPTPWRLSSSRRTWDAGSAPTRALRKALSADFARVCGPDRFVATWRSILPTPLCLVQWGSTVVVPPYVQGLARAEDYVCPFRLKHSRSPE